MEVMERRFVGGGGGCVADDDTAWKMGRILLRYRPIAPKPAAAGAVAGGAVQPAVCGGRERRRGGKRRQGGFTGGRRGRKSKKVAEAEAEASREAGGSWGTAAVLTLPLMPEAPERRGEEDAGGLCVKSPCFWQSWDRSEGSAVPVAGVVVAPRPVRVVAASVTVESVMEAWNVDLGGSIVADEVLRGWLDSEESPAFISDSGDCVTWSNAAFRRMVVGGGCCSESLSSSSSPSSLSSFSSSSSSGAMEEAAAEEVRVALVTGGLLTSSTCQSFACMARVRYACRSRGKVSLASPCDVWQMADGSLGWRLDVKAALSLSLVA